MSRHIRSWSGIHKARSNYTCVGCGLIIPIGQVHHSFVLSDDKDNPAHTAYRVRHHLDCAAPWYQPSDINRLHSFGRLPHQEPPASSQIAQLESLPVITVSYHSKNAGNITWQLPQNLSRRILYCPDLNLRTAAIFELKMVLATQAETIVDCAGHGKRAKKLGEVLYDMQLISSFTPHHYDWDVDMDTET